MSVVRDTTIVRIDATQYASSICRWKTAQTPPLHRKSIPPLTPFTLPHPSTTLKVNGMSLSGHTRVYEKLDSTTLTTWEY